MAAELMKNCYNDGTDPGVNNCNIWMICAYYIYILISNCILAIAWPNFNIFENHHLYDRYKWCTKHKMLRLLALTFYFHCTKKLILHLEANLALKLCSQFLMQSNELLYTKYRAHFPTNATRKKILWCILLKMASILKY